MESFNPPNKFSVGTPKSKKRRLEIRRKSENPHLTRAHCRESRKNPQCTNPLANCLGQALSTPGSNHSQPASCMQRACTSPPLSQPQEPNCSSSCEGGRKWKNSQSIQFSLKIQEKLRIQAWKSKPQAYLTCCPRAPRSRVHAATCTKLPHSLQLPHSPSLTLTSFLSFFHL